MTEINGSLCGVCGEKVPMEHAQIMRREGDGTLTSYHIGCEFRANQLETCEDCGYYRQVCEHCGEPEGEAE